MENNTYPNELLEQSKKIIEESKKIIPAELLEPTDSPLKCDFCEKEIIGNKCKYINKRPFRLRACYSCFRMVVFSTANNQLGSDVMKKLFPNAEELFDDRD